MSAAKHPKMKKTLLLIILCFMLILAACKKDHADNKKITSVASVIWGGEPAADGSGWYIKLQDSSEVHPNNLPEEFMQTQIIRQSVKVTFEYTGEKYQTGMMVYSIPVVKIYSIEKQ